RDPYLVRHGCIGLRPCNPGWRRDGAGHGGLRSVGNTAGPPWSPARGGNDLLGTFGFTGELQDGTSDLLYLRARWYDPGQSTFTSRDPFAGFPETPYSLHPYQYGYSNPVLWTDPTGACTFIGVDTAVCTLGAIVIVLAVAGGVIAVTPQSQEALDDATNAFMDLLRPITEWEEARRAARMIENFGYVTKPEGLALDPQLGAMRALIVVLDSWACLEQLPGFDLQMPDITDVLRLGPALERVLDPLTTPFPRGEEQGPVVMPVNVTGLPKDIAGNTHYLPTQPRVSKSLVQSYAEELLNDPKTFWKQFDFPIELTVAPNGTFITDEHHRFLAMKLAGLNFPEDVPSGQLDILPPQSNPFPQPYGRDPWKQIWQWDDVQWGP
ncbi:MAG: RHS repeat-associated core domain-containing protein, partial [Chloroflexales bacterium]|nr:RHS repeat-associated core domain-containing protein [Chloroflexales bacterium]